MKAWLCLAMAGQLLMPLAAAAEQTQAQGGNSMGGPSNYRSTTAHLDFQLDIDRMIFLRVGAGGAHSGAASGAGPSAGVAISQVNIVTPVYVPGATSGVAPGNSRDVAWTGSGSPLYAVSNAVTLPVEVRSNAGQVRLTAQTTGPLSSGTHQIPMSRISVSSDSAALPAPAIPASGISASVPVSTGGSGTAAAPTLLTYRSANWTFRYTPMANPVAGTYSGRILFSASAP